MNIKIKATFLIIITLIIGIVIGSMLTRILFQYRVRKMLPIRRDPSNVISHYEKVIKPDDKQRDIVRKILKKHAEQILEIRAKHRTEIETSMKSLRKELDTVLTPEQKKRLENNFRRFRRRFPRRRPFLKRNHNNS